MRNQKHAPKFDYETSYLGVYKQSLIDAYHRLKQSNHKATIVLSLAFILVLFTGLPQRAVVGMLDFTPSEAPINLSSPAPSLKATSDRVIAERSTELVKASFLIFYKDQDKESIRIREEYLLANFSDDPSKGLIRVWNNLKSQGGMLDTEVTGPTPHFKSISRTWIAPQVITKWIPLVDSNPEIGLPPPKEYDLRNPKLFEATKSYSKLSWQEETPLDQGFYAFLVDYDLRGIIQSNSTEEGLVLPLIYPSPHSMDSVEVFLKGFPKEVKVRTAYRLSSSGAFDLREGPKGNENGVVLSNIPSQTEVFLIMSWKY